MKIYNTLIKNVEPFVPLQNRSVRMYTCGPTPYNFVHLGNLRSFTAYDLVKRYLLYKGFNVSHIMNFTDVDDKTIRDSQKQGVTLKQFTQKYIDYFMDDIKALNHLPADQYPKATDYISEIVHFVTTLMNNGVAYRGEDGSIYFSIKKFPSYGKLSHIDLENLKAGGSGRVSSDEYTKDQVSDFVLWKAYTPEDGPVFWETALGKGRPGWHIECSVMARELLGDTFDLHMGGVDLMFPHHENEIAQSEACTHKQFSKYWLHVEHLLVNNQKMSKSLGNFYTLRDVLSKGYGQSAIRYALLSVHYRQKMNFTFEALDAAAAAVQRLQNFIDTLQAKGDFNPLVEEAILHFKKGFEAAMDDDFEISNALAAVFEFMHEINKLSFNQDNVAQIRAVMQQIDHVLGVLRFEQETIPEDVAALAHLREEARLKKDWKSADALRAQIEEKEYVVLDDPKGYKLLKKEKR